MRRAGADYMGVMMSQREGMSNFREIDAAGNNVTDTGPGTGDGQAGRSTGAGGMELLLAINPFIGVLWLLAAFLVGVGSWFLRIGAMGFGGMSGGAGPEFFFMMMNLAPWALILGIAVAACLLFWHAHQWQKRRDAPGGSRRRP